MFDKVIYQVSFVIDGNLVQTDANASTKLELILLSYFHMYFGCYIAPKIHM